MKEDEYEIGYGKPPKEHRFTKGQSGNPFGRKKAIKSIPELAFEVSRQKITLPVNGRLKSITRLEAAFLGLLNAATKGNHKAFEVLIRFLGPHFERLLDGSETFEITPRQRAAMEFFRARRPRPTAHGDTSNENDREAAPVGPTSTEEDDKSKK